ncbi:hypothetical protein LZT07_13620 [Vibrio fluvialis]|uniref:hypothetical protein n=1 Tax=Vibrio fluvialis TaxID=676 RepID=UPI001F253319|nr:hypothetical protein [Vibrio fluvialis]MCE7638359.1 hypothetical protein [Vibrio fluvialis]
MANSYGLKPLDAEFLNDLNPVHVFMSADQLSDELVIIRSSVLQQFPNAKVLPIHSSPPQDEIFSLIHSFFQSRTFASPPTQSQIDDTFQNESEPALESRISLLLYCLYRCGLAIESVDIDHNIDTFLVPNVWHLRWNQILCGSLNPAIVGFVPLYPQ